MGYSENYVKCKDCCGYIVGGRYTVKEFSITEGSYDKEQIYSGAVFTMDDNGEFCFRVNRKGSGSDAEWFNERAGGYRNTFGHDAGSLNFAFLGTLELDVEIPIGGETLKGTCVYQNIALAQGHSGASNNWWFGGMQCSYCGDSVTEIDHCVLGYGTLKASSVLTFFRRGGNSVNEVGVSFQHVLGGMSAEIQEIDKKK